MKFRGPIFLSVVALAFVIAVFFPKPVDTSQKESIIMRTLLTFVNQLHYNPKPINDDFSATLYDHYLNQVDGGRRFLTQEQIVQLKPFRLQLDEEIQEGTYAFFDQSLEFLNAGIEKAESYYPELLAQPFDFTKKEYIEFNGDDRPYAGNDAELKEYWRKSLKYEVLTRVARRIERETKKGEEAEPKSMEELEKEAREEVKESWDRAFNQISKYKRSNRLSGYLNSITQIFDPHSQYFEPIAKQNFDIRMSGEYEGIGARLMLDGDYTTVAEVMAGGPAWRGKEMRENDVFLKVAQGDEDEWQDILGWALDDVVQLIRGKKGTKVRLMIRSTDGTIKELSLIRDKIKTEETFAKSLILDGPEDGERLGYIFLPSFYGNFQDPDGRTCAKDVAKEIKKLKAEGVDGIMLDLRNNGGGYLGEAIKMTGLFIESGPVVQVKSRTRAAEVYRDLDKTVQYDGPLAIMTNNFSASASEIVAAALQDYNRAVIIGTESTHGKGSVQRIYDMDRVVRGNDDIKPLGNVKVTMQKYYRINGGSVQLRGVTPDIILPDSYQDIELGEAQEDYPLPWTEIDALDYSQSTYVLNSKYMDKLRKKSQQRIETNKNFQLINENAKRVAKNRDNVTYPLNLEAYQAFAAKRKAEADRFKDVFEKGANLTANNLKADYDYIHENEKNEALNEDFVKSVSKDLYIKETMNVLHDLIDIKKGK
ncbi:MAG: carboxy terminal-processing peptidase [Bacteroidota bacterium]